MANGLFTGLNDKDMHHERQALNNLLDKSTRFLGTMTWKTTKGMFKLLRGLQKSIGAIFARQNSQNPIVRHQSENALDRAQNQTLSLGDIKKLNGDRRLDNAKYERVRRFIDGLETKVGNRVNLDRGLQIDDYIFTKFINDRGEGEYQIADANSSDLLMEFQVDDRGEITFTRVPDENHPLLKYIDLAAREIGLNLDIIPARNLHQELQRLAENTRHLQSLVANLEQPQDLDKAIEQSRQINEAIDRGKELYRLGQLLEKSLVRHKSLLQFEYQNRPEELQLKSQELNLLAQKLIDIRTEVEVIEHQIQTIGSKLEFNRPEADLQSEQIPTSPAPAPELDRDSAASLDGYSIPAVEEDVPEEEAEGNSLELS
jgi:hypothetical protein